MVLIQKEIKLIPNPDIIIKFQRSLPLVKNWIDDLLYKNQENAVSVINCDLPRVKQVFHTDLLKRAKVVTVTNKIPVPPLSQIGLPELVEIEQMDSDGITYKDTFFIKQDSQNESLYFHELVHVVQWETLGVDNFLTAYGLGLMLYGYENSLLEQMAYYLQNRFDAGNLPQSVTNFIQQQTDIIWNQVKQLFEKL